ncbi:MAG: NACHT domain-containing protein [Candidatus Aminicenantes bacterium]|nr:MAG: NACHT domain-containing protein [Candidatus Aminicenantes bacterium]
MENIPPLTKVIDKGSEGGFEFERLMKKLLIHDGSLKGYEFEPGVTNKDGGIDGKVSKNYPGIDCPVIFQFKWLEGPINKGNAGRQIKKSFESLVKSGIRHKSYVLVTPHDLTPSEKQWLAQLPSTYKMETNIHHYGHIKIQVLLDAYPALKKYYYGERVQGVSRNFNVVKEDYRQAIIEEVKHLRFIGIPTGNYEKQQLMVKPELAKVYISLDFSHEKDASEITTLQAILNKSNRVVVLGDPGAGKSTLAKYLALLHSQKLENNKAFHKEDKVPFIIPIREFVRLQQERSEPFNFIDYLKHISEANYSFNNMDEDFFISQLGLGKAIVLFDGLDEVASEAGRIRIAQNIQQFARSYPDTLIWVTSRIVGYTVDVKLDPRVFDHYYLAPVKLDQAREFIKKWYEIQIPKEKTLRVDRIHSLCNAVEENPGVQRLKTNPLLLTLMTLVHQFEGTLPDDRAKLYEKCIELLLKTWQEQKYITLGLKNPLEERGISYDDQLKMLAATAFYIQEKNQDMKAEDTRGLIEEDELARVLFKARFDKKRMPEESAKEDVKRFIDYIRDRAGLFVEKGRNKKGENVFAFVHLSFLEYLCAYQVAEDKSKSQQQHIHELLRYIKKAAWEEPILLSLYLFTKSTGPSFIDAFTEAVFENLSRHDDPNGWFLMARAVRDNINFAHEDIKRINREIVKIWLTGSEKTIAFSILKEIVKFSKKGKNILKEIIKENIKNNPAEKAFESLYLYKEFYEIDSAIPGIISENKDYLDLLPYLPVYQDDPILKDYIEENLEEPQWNIYYNGAADKTTENLDKLLTAQLNPFEIKGQMISSWSRVFAAFQQRNRFLKINKSGPDPGIKFNNIRCNFDYANVNYPLTLFLHFIEKIEYISPKTITNQWFILEDKGNQAPINNKFLSGWINKILSNALALVERYNSSNKSISHANKEGIKHIKKSIDDFSVEFSRNFIREFGRDFSRDFIRYFNLDFIRYFSREFSLEFSRNFSLYFNREFSRDFSQDFSRCFSQVFNLGFSREFSTDSSKDIGSLVYDSYYKKYDEKGILNWDELHEKNFQVTNDIYTDEFKNNNMTFIDKFFNDLCLYIHLTFHQFTTKSKTIASIVHSFSGQEPGKVRQRQPSISIASTLMLPFEPGFILTGVLGCYAINLLADMSLRFHEKEELENGKVLYVVDRYCKKNPIEFYFINFAWDFYSKAFNERYPKFKEVEEKNLALAAFVVNAARVSLAAGVPCEGEEWEKTLKEAGKSNHPFVQISHTLYKLCNFIDRETNSELLKNQLKKFKLDYPDYYKLIGFQED